MNSKQQLKQMAISSIEYKKQGDHRYNLMVDLICMLTNLGTSQVEYKNTTIS